MPAGEVTFQVKNTGTEEHEFEIFQGETVVDEIEGLVPGLTKDLTVTLAAGDYTFKCLLNGHDALGMTGHAHRHRELTGGPTSPSRDNSRHPLAVGTAQPDEVRAAKPDSAARARRVRALRVMAGRDDGPVEDIQP